MNAAPQNQPQKIAKLIGLVIAVSLALGACGGSDTSVESEAVELPTLAGDDTETDGTEVTGDAPTEEDMELAMAQYEVCLSDLGVDISGLTGGGGAAVDDLQVADGTPGEDFDIEEFELAVAECESVLEGVFGDFTMSPEEEAELADANLQLERCIREADLGIEFDGVGMIVPEGVDIEEFEKVLKTCEQSIDLFNVEAGQ